MKFMITFNHIAGAWEALTDAERETYSEALLALMDDLEAERDSRLVFFAPAAEAKTVRMQRDGELAVSDGPSTDSTEQPGGYYIIEADSIDEAVEWAKRGRLLVGSNQVRQIVEP